MGDDVLHSHHGILFAWRCVRVGMWRARRARRLVWRQVVRRVPIIRRCLDAKPMEIMRAAAQISENSNDPATR